MQTDLQSAYVLHTRPYRDTSLLVDLLTPNQGRITAVARGMRSRKAAKRTPLNPFVRLLVSFHGKRDLKLLTQVETEGQHRLLSGKYLFSGFYLNELLVRLLPEHDGNTELFARYETALDDLQAQRDIEPVLRHFELALLNDLGYGIDFSCDAGNGDSIESGWYVLDTAAGFFSINAPVAGRPIFNGEHLRAIAARDWQLQEVRQTAKQLSRLLLKPLLGSRPLMSRELFSQLPAD